VAEFQPQVVLIDIGMPGMDGFEVIRRLRADFRERPMILITVTGYGQEEDIRNYKTAGFDAYLLKPVQLDELQNAIAAAVLSGAAAGAAAPPAGNGCTGGEDSAGGTPAPPAANSPDHS
jgi:CheY-like chemotaxis protein